jgi:hypothetical protein
MINTKHAHMYIYINHTTGMRLTMLLNIHMQKSTSQQLSLKSIYTNYAQSREYMPLLRITVLLSNFSSLLRSIILLYKFSPLFRSTVFLSNFSPLFRSTVLLSNLSPLLKRTVLIYNFSPVLKRTVLPYNA